MTTIDHQQAAVRVAAEVIAPHAYDKVLWRCTLADGRSMEQTALDAEDTAQDALSAAAPHLRAAWEQQMSSADMAGGDEYHTLEELYEYRMLYNAHAAQGWLSAGIPVVKSWHHSDGEECFGGGWFIVTAQLPTGQVSNHYPAKDWDLFNVPWVDVAPEWDGHTPQQAADRLRNHLKGTRK